MDKASEDDIEFFKALEDTAKQPFDFIALSIHGFIVFPRIQTITLGRYDGDIAEIERPLACFIAFVGAVHDQRGGLCHRPKIDQKLASCGRIVILAGGESEGDCAAITRGNQMNFGGPATSGFADGLGTIFFERRYHHRGAP